MDLSIYVRPILKWWWLILAAVVVAGGSSYVAASFQPDIYQSRTTLIVGRFILDPNPEGGQIYTSQQLAPIYADLANREPIQEATKDALGVDWLPSYDAKVIPQSQIIEITVRDEIPERAQIFANEFARQVIFYSPASDTSSVTNRQEFIETQLDRLQDQIVQTQEDITALQQDLGDLNSAREIADTNAQIGVLESKLISLQRGYADLLSNTSEGANNIIQVLEPANLPVRPVGPNKIILIAPALAIAAMLSSGAAFLLEFLNKSLESVQALREFLPLPVLGEIPTLTKEESQHSWTFIDKKPISSFSEAFRRLRTNIEVSYKNKNLKSILVSSSAEADGKSTVTTNLAIAYSYLGKKVLIVDADFRRHRIHTAFDLEKKPGLSEVLSGDCDIQDAIQHWKGKIFVLPSGEYLPNSSELVSSDKFNELLGELEDIADLVIIDGPPFFLSETSSISNRVQGVLIVVSVGNSKDMINLMKEQLEVINSPILGMVINRASGTQYYGYYYSSYEVPTKPVSTQKQDLSSNRESVFSRVLTLVRNRGYRGQTGNDQIKAASQDGDEGSVVIQSEVGGSKKASQNVKTIPRLLNPKDLLDKVIMKSSKKSVDEDKEYLQEIARKKRDQSQSSSDDDTYDDFDVDGAGLKFLNTLEANDEINADQPGENGLQEEPLDRKNSDIESENLESEQKSEDGD